jgi:hypothetical protein
MQTEPLTRFARCLVAVGAIAVAVSCNKSPTAPSGEGASFAAQLSPGNEDPPVANAEFSGSGNASISISITRDSAGAIATATAAFQVSLIGFPPGTTLTMAHIHRGAAGTSGPVVVDTGLAMGELVLTAGTGAFTKAGISIQPALAQEMMNSPGQFYFNVHSVLNSFGMARGQLERQ